MTCITIFQNSALADSQTWNIKNYSQIPNKTLLSGCMDIVANGVGKQINLMMSYLEVNQRSSIMLDSQFVLLSWLSIRRTFHRFPIYRTFLFIFRPDVSKKLSL